ncbi:MAG: hypothetical protein ACREAW_06265 [Nitrososphaera sp.]
MERQEMKNVASSSSSISFSADAADRLEKAINFMITTFLDDGLIQKGDVVNLLEDIIQTIESPSADGKE